MKKIKVSGEQMVRMVLACLGLCEIVDIDINGKETVKVVCKVKREEPLELQNIDPLDNCPNFTDWRVEQNGEELQTVSFCYHNCNYDCQLDELTMDMEDFEWVLDLFLDRVFHDVEYNDINIDDSTGVVRIKVEVVTCDMEPLELDKFDMLYLVLAGMKLNIVSAKEGEYVIELH